MAITLLAGAACAENGTLTIESWRNDDLTIWQDKLIPAVEAGPQATQPVLKPATKAHAGTVVMGIAKGVVRAAAAAKAALTGFATAFHSVNLGLVHRLKAPAERRFEDVARSAHADAVIPLHDRGGR